MKVVKYYCDMCGEVIGNGYGGFYVFYYSPEHSHECIGFRDVDICIDCGHEVKKHIFDLRAERYKNDN